MIAASAVQRQMVRTSVDFAESNLAHLENALVAYLRINRRLPSADINGDGWGDSQHVETVPGDSSSVVTVPENLGTVPYVELGLPSPPVDGRKLPFIYAANESLLTANPLTSAANQYDLCQQLRAIALDRSTDQLHSSGNEPLAFVVLSPGSNNVLVDGATVFRDEVDVLTDRAGVGGLRFEVDAISDDRFRQSSVLSLLGELNCPGAVVAANAIESEILSANITKAALQHVKQNTIDLKGNAEHEIVMAVFSEVAAVADVASAAATMIDASAQAAGVGNGAAVAAAAAGVAAAAAAVVVTTAEVIVITTSANEDIKRLNIDIENLDTHIARAAKICEGIRAQVVAIKGRAVACD